MNIMLTCNPRSYIITQTVTTVCINVPVIWQIYAELIHSLLIISFIDFCTQICRQHVHWMKCVMFCQNEVWMFCQHLTVISAMCWQSLMSWVIMAGNRQLVLTTSSCCCHPKFLSGQQKIRTTGEGLIIHMPHGTRWAHHLWIDVHDWPL